MKTKMFLLQVFDLFLTDDEGLESWKEIPLLRRSGYTLLASLFAFIVMRFVFSLLPLGNSELYTVIYRWTTLFLLLIVATSLIFMTYSYFRFIVSENRPVILSNVIFFYVAQIIIWGSIYMSIYTIDTTTFVYINPSFEVLPTVVRSVNVLISRMHFFIFSALSSLNADFYRITANSIVVSILKWCQSLFTLSLLSLLIASYVNQKSHLKIAEKDQKKTEQDKD